MDWRQEDQEIRGEEFLIPVTFTRSISAAFLAAGLILGLTGCAQKSELRQEKIGREAANQDFKKAIAQIRKQGGPGGSLYGSQSKLLGHMDLGLLYHFAGMYDSSIIELAKASSIADELFTKSVTNEAVSLLTNDNVRPYRGKPYELTFMRTVQALNYLALGKPDEARVEIRQGQIHLDEVARLAGKDKGAYRDDALFRALSGLVYEMTGDRDDALISYFKSLKAYRSQGGAPDAFRRYALRALSLGGREDDLKNLGLDPPSPSPDALEPVPGQDGEIILIGHAGRSAEMQETMFWGTWVRDGILTIHFKDASGKTITEILPAPGLPASELAKAGSGGRTRSGTTFHVKFSMPSIKTIPSRARRFALSIDGVGTTRSESWSELNQHLEDYFAENRVAILTRTVIRVVVRTIANEKTKSAVRTDNPLINLLVNVGADVLTDQLEQADTRHWFLMPRTLEVARIRVKPGSYTATAGALDIQGIALHSQVFSGLQVKAGEKRVLVLSYWK